MVHKQLNAISIDTERLQIFHFKVIGLAEMMLKFCESELRDIHLGPVHVKVNKKISEQEKQNMGY